MKLTHLAPVLAVAVCTCASAIEAPPDSCAYERTQTIAFRSKSSIDRLRLAVGTGPCQFAKVTILIESSAGRQLYRETVDLQRQSFFDWASPELQQEVRTFVDKLAVEVSTPAHDLPRLDNFDEEPIHQLLLPARDYKRLLASRQNVFHHPTYYEGGVYFIYDAKLRQSRVLASWGL